MSRGQAAVSAGALARPRAARGGRSPAGWRWRVAGVLLVATALFFAMNWVYQVVRKPTELLAPVGVVLAKAPPATWAAYGHLFREHATDVVTAEFLAALAQVEGSGNPVASTYWRWQWSLNPFEVYRPASSAVGMFQITDATFREATRYCIHDHRLTRDGPWYEPRSCWFNILYSRIVPSHAVELTAAHLHQAVVAALARQRVVGAGLEQKQGLAAVIHLCGPRRGDLFVRRGFHPAPAERCGDHDLRRYLDRVRHLQREFTRLDRAG